MRRFEHYNMDEIVRQFEDDEEEFNEGDYEEEEEEGCDLMECWDMPTVLMD